MSDYLAQQPVRNDGIYDGAENENPSSSGVITSNRAAVKSVSTMDRRVSSVSGDDNRECMDVAMSDGNGNGIDVDNPMPVYVTDSPSTEILDYDAAAAVAASGGTSNHDYTTTSEFRQLAAYGSSSGLAKFELQVESAPLSGTFNTLMVKFNSVSNPNVDMVIKSPAPVASGVIIRVVKTNLEKGQATDLYSSINGLEV